MTHNLNKEEKALQQKDNNYYPFVTGALIVASAPIIIYGVQKVSIVCNPTKFIVTSLILIIKSVETTVFPSKTITPDVTSLVPYDNDFVEAFSLIKAPFFFEVINSINELVYAAITPAGTYTQTTELIAYNSNPFPELMNLINQIIGAVGSDTEIS